MTDMTNPDIHMSLPNNTQLIKPPAKEPSKPANTVSRQPWSDLGMNQLATDPTIHPNKQYHNKLNTTPALRCLRLKLLTTATLGNHPRVRSHHPGPTLPEAQ